MYLCHEVSHKHSRNHRDHCFCRWVELWSLDWILFLHHETHIVLLPNLLYIAVCKVFISRPAIEISQSQSNKLMEYQWWWPMSAFKVLSCQENIPNHVSKRVPMNLCVFSLQEIPEGCNVIYKECQRWCSKFFPILMILKNMFFFSSCSMHSEVC